MKMKNSNWLLLLFTVMLVGVFSCEISGDLPEEEEESKIEEVVPYGVKFEDKVIEVQKGRYVRYYNYLFKVKGYVKEKGLPRQQLSEVFVKRDKDVLISIEKQKQWLLDEYGEKWIEENLIDYDIFQIGHVWVYEEVEKDWEEKYKKE